MKSAEVHATKKADLMLEAKSSKAKANKNLFFLVRKKNIEKWITRFVATYLGSGFTCL